MPRFYFLLTAFLLSATSAAYSQWLPNPLPDTRSYTKPVAEDTFKIKDYYNSNYSVRLSSDTVLGRDTIIIAPLATNTRIKHLPYLKGDVQLLRRTLTYPRTERQAGIQGQCYAYLSINAHGTIDSVWIERGLTKTLDAHVAAAVKTLPPFKPARYNGHRAATVCYYRIRFGID